MPRKLGARSARASVPFIFSTIFLDALGIGLLIPVMPDVIRRFGTDPEFVTRYYGFFISAYALMQFLASPVLGSLSDRFGRRPILLVSLLGASLDYVLMALAPTLAWLFVGRLISGLTGASMTVASSYMADISDDTNRSANFGMIGAAFGLGFIFGPALGGLLGDMGPAAPFLVAAGLNLINFLFGYFVLPESLAPELRRPLALRRFNPFGTLSRYLIGSPIAVLVWGSFFFHLSGQSHPSIWTLYTQHKFGWTAFQVGLSLSFVGVTIAVVQGGLTRVIVPRLGEWRSVFVGLGFYAVGFALFAIANQGWMMYAILVPFALGGIAPPALQSLASKRVPPQEQGEFQGSLISIASLTAIIGPLLYTSLFAHFTSAAAAFEFSGAPYAAAAVLCLIAAVVLAVSHSRAMRA